MNHMQRVTEKAKQLVFPFGLTGTSKEGGNGAGKTDGTTGGSSNETTVEKENKPPVPEPAPQMPAGSPVLKDETAVIAVLTNMKNEQRAAEPKLTAAEK